MNKTLWKSVWADDELNYNVMLRYDGALLSIWIKEEGISKAEPLGLIHAAYVHDGVQTIMKQQLGEDITQNVLSDPKQLWVETKDYFNIKLPQQVIERYRATAAGSRYTITLSTDGFTLFFEARAEGQSRNLTPKQMKPELQQQIAKKYSLLARQVMQTHQIAINSAICAQIDVSLPQVGRYVQAIEHLKERGFVITPEYYEISFEDKVIRSGIQAYTFKLRGIWYASVDQEGLLACHQELNEQRQQMRDQEKMLKQQINELREKQEYVTDAQDELKEILSKL